jgi:hypothetical protein
MRASLLQKAQLCEALTSKWLRISVLVSSIIAAPVFTPGQAQASLTRPYIRAEIAEIRHNGTIERSSSDITFLDGPFCLYSQSTQLTFPAVYGCGEVSRSTISANQ